MTEPLELRTLDSLRRDREAPAPDDARARVAARLGVSGPLPKPPARGESGASAARGGAHTASWLGVAFVAGAAMGALLHAGLATAPAARVVYVDRPALPTPSVLASAMSPSTPAPSAEDSALSANPLPAAGPSSPPRPGLTQLDAERALLDAARLALVTGDSDTALRALDRHARTYGRPLLGEERDALFVQALVRAGRFDEARARAEVFRRRAPQSLFLGAVDAAIASIP